MAHVNKIIEIFWEQFKTIQTLKVRFYKKIKKPLKLKATGWAKLVVYSRKTNNKNAYQKSYLATRLWWIKNYKNFKNKPFLSTVQEIFNRHLNYYKKVIKLSKNNKYNLNNTPFTYLT
jgi:hypothetical protein